MRNDCGTQRNRFGDEPGIGFRQEFCDRGCGITGIRNVVRDLNEVTLGSVVVDAKEPRDLVSCSYPISQIISTVN